MFIYLKLGLLATIIRCRVICCSSSFKMLCCKFMSIFKYPKIPSQKSDYPLARFFYADLELRRITHDLDSFDGNKEPQR